MKHCRSRYAWLLVALLVLCAGNAAASSQTMSTKTVANFITELRDLLNDKDSENYFFGDDELLRWTNAGAAELATVAHCFEDLVTINLAAGQIFYALPANYLAVVAVVLMDATGGNPRGLLKGSPASIGASQEDLLKGKRVVGWFTFKHQLGVYPLPAAGTTEKLTVMLALPATAAADTNATLPVPAIYEQALRYYVLSQALYKDKQSARAASFLTLFYQVATNMRAELVEPLSGNREVK
jgi:hypothetical protein